MYPCSYRKVCMFHQVLIYCLFSDAHFYRKWGMSSNRQELGTGENRTCRSLHCVKIWSAVEILLCRLYFCWWAEIPSQFSNLTSSWKQREKKKKKTPLEVNTFLSQTDHLAIQEGSLTLEKGVLSLKRTYVIFNPSLPLFLPRSSFPPGTIPLKASDRGHMCLNTFI